MNLRNALPFVLGAAMGCTGTMPIDPSMPSTGEPAGAEPARSTESVRSAAWDYTWTRLGGAAPQTSIADWAANHPRAQVADPAFVAPRPGGRAAYAQAAAPPIRVPLNTDAVVDWNITTPHAINSTPAVWTAQVSSQSNANDRLYTQFSSGTADYLRAYKDLYTTTPTRVWDLPLDSPIDGSAVALNVTGSFVFAVTGGAGVANGAVMWMIDVNALSANGVYFNNGPKVQWSSPWPDFERLPIQVYVGDLSGGVWRIDSSNNAGARFGISTRAIHSTPIVWSGTLWIGDDGGTLYALDTTRTDNTMPILQTLSLCGGGFCSTSDAIWGSPYIDTVNKRLIIGVDNRIWTIGSVDTCARSTCTATSKTLPGVSNSSGIFKSNVLKDQNGGAYVYAAHANTVFRCDYTAAGGVTACSNGNGNTAAPLGLGADGSFPRSSPMQYPGNNSIYIGDGGGYLNRFDNAGSPGGHGLQRVSTFQATSGTVTVTNIDSMPVIDFLSSSTGFIYYGGSTNTASTAGMIVQVPQTF